MSGTLRFIPRVFFILVLVRFVCCLTWNDFVLEMKQKSYSNHSAQKNANESVAASGPSSQSNPFSSLAPSDSMYRLIEFYTFLSDPSVKRCSDPTHLMPHCTDCIPGLQRSTGNTSCDILHSSSVAIRDEIVKLTQVRFGSNKIHPLKPFALYPYLESPDYMARQETFGPLLQDRGVRHIIDIGKIWFTCIEF